MSVCDRADKDERYDKMAKLILVRGLPGSGKSTFARELSGAGYKHVEADMFHIDPVTGKYDFIPQHVRAAHEWCQAVTRMTLADGVNVVVSNTFTQLWEMEPYFRMGAERVTIVECTGHYGNVHGVPADKVDQMRARWQTVTEGWLQSVQSGYVK